MWIGQKRFSESFKTFKIRRKCVKGWGVSEEMWKNYLDDGCPLLFPILFVVIVIATTFFPFDQIFWVCLESAEKYLSMRWHEGTGVTSCWLWGVEETHYARNGLCTAASTSEFSTHQAEIYILSLSNCLPYVPTNNWINFSPQPPRRNTATVPTSLQFSYLWSIMAWKYYAGKSIHKQSVSFKLGAILSIVIKSGTIPPVPPKTWTFPLFLCPALLCLCCSSLVT